jgi:hypothetical protein
MKTFKHKQFQQTKILILYLGQSIRSARCIKDLLKLQINNPIVGLFTEKNDEGNNLKSLYKVFSTKDSK